jgi:ABC-type Fe3+/spermidine/putrescine transport system ATPase subunit
LISPKRFAQINANTPATVLKLLQISKRFADTLAVDELSLTVREGEILALLGPSGCGKTTTLRMVAGLEDPSAGKIHYDGNIVASATSKHFVPPNKRNIGVVFQSYALWPHMTVFANVAHPLKVRRVKRKDIHERVLAVLASVGLKGYEDRPVPKLSGGQQQRVALARAIVYEPRMLLLDEPFSNLDALLRTQMRLELRAIQRRLGIATLFVTHDQVEAMSFADRIAVINEGRLIQIGTPQELYCKPVSPFVRDFLGRVIVSPGKLVAVNARTATVEVPGFCTHNLRVDGIYSKFSAGIDLEISIRPEDIEIVNLPLNPAADNQVSAVIKTLLFLGDRWEAEIQLASSQIFLHLPKSGHWREGMQITLGLPSHALQLWPTT